MAAWDGSYGTGPGVLGVTMVAALAYAVALSFTSPPHSGPLASTACRARGGRLDHRPFNRRCVRGDMEGLCYTGTGETRTAIFVCVRGRRYHVVDERVVWVAPPCAPVA